MYLIFFDEVKPQPDYPYYHIGAICIAEEHFALIEQEVNRLASEIFGDVMLRPSTEFHAHDIFHKKKSFKQMMDVPKRLDILSRLLKILMKPEILLIQIRINIEKLYNHEPAADYAFMFLCERANALMKAKNAFGLLIGDRDSDANAERFSTGLFQYRAKGTNYTYREEITHLFESVHFTHSHLSRFLQLADIYAWFLQFQKRNQIKRQEQHAYFLEMLREREISLIASKYKIWPS